MAEDPQNPDLTDEEKNLFGQLTPQALSELSDFGEARRHFLKLLSLAGGGVLLTQLPVGQQAFARSLIEPPLHDGLAVSVENVVRVTLRVNGSKKLVDVDSRMTLLDTLRERLALTGSKKGCDHGQCGSCTVLIGDRRVLACLTLAATCEGKSVRTIEGLATDDGPTSRLHPMQAAFVKHDGAQCGYCTPGQICSAVALLDEADRGEASYVTPNVRSVARPLPLSEVEIRERMSGNICRCGAYPNIVAAIREVHGGKAVAQTWHTDGMVPLIPGNGN